MDNKILKTFINFSFLVILMGILTNTIVTIMFSNVKAVNDFILCPLGDTSCIIKHLTIFTLIIVFLVISMGFIVNIIWWRNLLSRIKAGNISFEEQNTDPTCASIFITNGNKKSFDDLEIRPLWITLLSWPHPELNFQTEGLPFNITHKKIPSNTEIKVDLAEISGDKTKGFITNFLINNGLHAWQFFPVDQTNETSIDRERNLGDLYAAIYEIIIEISGKIADSQITKIYYGKFVQFLLEKKWRRESDGKTWLKVPPTFETNIEWIEFRECSNKKKAQKNKYKNENGFTQEEFYKMLNSLNTAR